MILAVPFLEKVFKTQKIFLLVIFFFSLSSLGVFSVQAEENISLDFCATVQADENNIYQKISDDTQTISSPSERYKKIKKTYHQNISKIFSEHFEKIFGDTNVNDTPKNICHPFQFAAQTKSQEITQKLNIQHKYYECTLLHLAKNPTIDPSQYHSILAGIGNLQSQEHIFFKEISDSYAAKETTLQTYEEMRMWYPVHRDLQCLIQQLTDYNTEIRNFVDRVVILPKKFLNYGSRKAY